MKRAMDLVAEFHRKFGAPINGYLEEIDLARKKLRLKLLVEEVAELASALGGSESVVAIENAMMAIDADDFSRLGVLTDFCGICDALADISYLTAGSGVEWGLPLYEVFEEVHRSNMSKTPGNNRPDGKILKGPDFKPPRIAEILEGFVCGFCGKGRIECEDNRYRFNASKIGCSERKGK